MKKESKHAIFIVDDHPLLRRGLAQFINEETELFVCGEAGDIKDALQGIGERRPDIAILDISLGQGSGLRLMEDLRNLHPAILILVLSMHDESVYAERCLKAGAKGYIMKTEPPEKVISAMRAILNGEIYVSEKIQKNILNKLTSNQFEVQNSPLACLSNRELEVFQLIGFGLKTQQISAKLNLSVKTIETYIDHIKRKMNFRSYHELLMYAIRQAMSENMV
ncbi:MAG: response regulator transcription factor [Nitrospirae bacterium]|nr:response regulator transcription factor [Nitrospirota bacterium]